MSELSELYQDLILDHNKSPRNFRPLPDARKAEGYNPLCGDRITVYLKEVNGIIEDISFQGSGCALSKASASMMTERLKGLPIKEAGAVFAQFHNMVTGREAPTSESNLQMGKLEVFSHVHEYPMRVKCASLAWHTLNAALNGNEEPGTTD